MKQRRFPKSARLLKSHEYDRVFRRRCIASDAYLVLHVAQGITDQTRLGLVVSRKCGNAVVRNRWKRAIREAFRLVRCELPPRIDLVIIPKRSAEPTPVPPLAELQASLAALARRAIEKLESTSKGSP